MSTKAQYEARKAWADKEAQRKSNRERLGVLLQVWQGVQHHLTDEDRDTFLSEVFTLLELPGYVGTPEKVDVVEEESIEEA